MCLLVAVSRLDPGAPLVVGANRDERLDRPATSMTVLRHSGPRVLGGRDEQAGGTWLAVNEHGVVAGLTNRPSPEGRDPAKRSRGELPLALAMHGDAASAVADFTATFRPSHYNPAWLLVGDRTSLYFLDMTGPGSGSGSGSGPGDDVVYVEQLGPGVHVLENTALHAASAKADHVRALIGDVAGLEGDPLLERLRSLLVDHSGPDVGTVGGEHFGAGGPTRPVETLAPCVHTDEYGTRSSTLVRVPAASRDRPRVFVADGRPCESPYVEVSDLFDY